MQADTSFDHNELHALTDADVLAIWLGAVDPEHPTPREEAALRVIEARNLDF